MVFDLVDPALVKEMRGKGYGTEAVRMMVAYLILSARCDVIKLNRVNERTEIFDILSPLWFQILYPQK